MNIGQRIVMLRNKKNWSQRELARRVGLNVSVMNRIELGERPIKDQELVSVANVLDVSTDYLLGLTEIPDVNKTDFEKILDDPETNALFQDWKNMNEEQRQEALKLMQFILFKDGKK